ASHGLVPAVVVHAQRRDLEDHVAGVRPAAIDAEADGSTDHELRELALGAVRRSAAAGDPSAPDHGDAIRDLEDLVELVADEDDARALRAKLPEHAEDLARLLRREDGGRLVEDEDPRVAVDRLEDLNALLLADGELIDAGRGLDIEPQLLREQPDPLRRLGEVEDLADANDLLSENDVLGDREDRDQHEVLVHHADPACDRVGGVADRHGPAVDADLAFVRRDEAVEDVHERRLARAVLAEQRVDLAFAEVEVDRVVRERPGREALRDAPHLQDGRYVAHGLLMRRAGRP